MLKGTHDNSVCLLLLLLLCWLRSGLLCLLLLLLVLVCWPEPPGWSCQGVRQVLAADAGRQHSCGLNEPPAYQGTVSHAYMY